MNKLNKKLQQYNEKKKLSDFPNYVFYLNVDEKNKQTHCFGVDLGRGQDPGPRPLHLVDYLHQFVSILPFHGQNGTVQWRGALRLQLGGNKNRQ